MEREPRDEAALVITLSALAFLTGPAGERVLADLAAQDLTDARTLPLITALRRSLPADEAGAALELARLRQKAVPKFGAHAARLFFTREALEQASDPQARAYHAARQCRASPSRISAAGLARTRWRSQRRARRYGRWTSTRCARRWPTSTPRRSA